MSNKNLRLSGTLQNLMPADLEDVWVFYRDRCYSLKQPLARPQVAAARNSRSLWKRVTPRCSTGWAGHVPPQFQPEFRQFPGDRPPNANYDPTTDRQTDCCSTRRPIQKARSAITRLRPIDQSCATARRLRKTGATARARGDPLRPVQTPDRSRRDARRNTDQPLATLLWLDDVPGKRKTARPTRRRQPCGHYDAGYLRPHHHPRPPSGELGWCVQNSQRNATNGSEGVCECVVKCISANPCMAMT